MRGEDPLAQTEEYKRLGKRVNDAVLNDVPDTGNNLRRRILTLNQRARNSREQMGHFESTSLVLQIPELDYAVLLHRFPELNSPDPTENKNAWDKFLCAPESEPYRVRAHDGKRGLRLGN